MFIIMCYERLGRSIYIIPVREEAGRSTEFLAPKDVGRVWIVRYCSFGMTPTETETGGPQRRELRLLE